MDISFLQDIIDMSHDALIKERVPAGVLPYLMKTRGLKPRTIKKFQIGFCGFELEKSINNDYYSGKRDYPIFTWPMYLRDKIIVPIKDDFGELMAIATRSVGSGGGWWNTPFVKSNCLFGLGESRAFCFKENKMFIVEGYMDFLILFQEGLCNVASPMGTKFTLAHAGLALRYCDRLCLCFDTDPLSDSGKPGAGQKATLRTKESVGNYFEISTINLPLKVDPDEYVLKNGFASLLALEKTHKSAEGYVNGESWS